MNETLEDLRLRLRDLAGRLRSGEEPGDEVLAVIEECAALATEAAGAVETSARAAVTPLPDMPGQLPLASA